jgi:predicted Zn-dependent protease
MVILAVTLITACSKETKKARLLGEADKYFKAGNYDKAKLSYLNVVRLDPQNALAFERIGAMWQDDGAPLRAAAFLRNASVLDPNNVENRIRLARCYLATGRPRQEHVHVATVGFLVAAAVRGAVRAFATTLTQS